MDPEDLGRVVGVALCLGTPVVIIAGIGVVVWVVVKKSRAGTRTPVAPYPPVGPPPYGPPQSYPAQPPSGAHPQPPTAGRLPGPPA